MRLRNWFTILLLSSITLHSESQYRVPEASAFLISAPHGETKSFELAGHELRELAHTLPLDGLKLRLDGARGSFRPSPALRALGLQAHRFALPRPTFRSGPFKLQAWLQNVSLSRTEISVDRDTLRLEMFFADGNHAIHVNPPAPNYHFDGMRFTSRLAIRTDEEGIPRLYLEQAELSGNLAPASPPAELLTGLSQHLAEFRGTIEATMRTELAVYLDHPSTQAGFQRALLEYAAARAGGRPWRALTSLSLKGNRLHFSAVRSSNT